MTDEGTGGAAAALDPMLCFAIYSAERQVARLYREALAPWDLSYTQYVALIALWNEDGLTVGGLGALLGLDSGTLSPMLKRLEARGLLTRTRRPDDERVVRVTLTDEGRELRRISEEVQRCFVERMPLSLAEAGDLRSRLRGLTGRMAASAA